MARYRRQPLIARNMPDCGMTAVDHRCRTWMQPDPLLKKIFCPFPNVASYQFIDVQTSGAGQSNNIGCSVVPLMRESGSVRSKPHGKRVGTKSTGCAKLPSGHYPTPI